MEHRRYFSQNAMNRMARSIEKLELEWKELQTKREKNGQNNHRQEREERKQNNEIKTKRKSTEGGKNGKSIVNYSKKPQRQVSLEREEFNPMKTVKKIQINLNEASSYQNEAIQNHKVSIEGVKSRNKVKIILTTPQNRKNISLNTTTNFQRCEQVSAEPVGKWKTSGNSKKKEKLNQQEIKVSPFELTEKKFETVNHKNTNKTPKIKSSQKVSKINIKNTTTMSNSLLQSRNSANSSCLTGKKNINNGTIRDNGRSFDTSRQKKQLFEGWVNQSGKSHLTDRRKEKQYNEIEEIIRRSYICVNNF